MVLFPGKKTDPGRFSECSSDLSTIHGEKCHRPWDTPKSVDIQKNKNSCWDLLGTFNASQQVIIEFFQPFGLVLLVNPPPSPMTSQYGAHPIPCPYETAPLENHGGWEFR